MDVDKNIPEEIVSLLQQIVDKTEALETHGCFVSAVFISKDEKPSQVNNVVLGAGSRYFRHVKNINIYELVGILMEQIESINQMKATQEFEKSLQETEKEIIDIEVGVTREKAIQTLEEEEDKLKIDK